MKNITFPAPATVPSAFDHHFRQANTFLLKAMAHLTNITPDAFAQPGSPEAATLTAALATLTAAAEAVSTAATVAPIVHRRPRKAKA